MVISNCFLFLIISFLNLSTGHGNSGFGVLFGLNGHYPILLCGVSIFLPHPNFIRNYNSITVAKEGYNDNLEITIKVHEHGTSQVGPKGNYILNKLITFLVRVNLTLKITNASFDYQYDILL